MLNRQLFNYHTHTSRCGHASDESDEAYVKAAIKAGFKTLGFSDHGPFREYSKPGDRMDPEFLDGYLESIYSLKEKYRGIIDIKVGSEFEYYDEHLDQIKELSEKCEYLILGQHYPHPSAEKDYCLNLNDKQSLELYGEQLCKGMESGYFLYVAHPDYFCGAIRSFDENCEKLARKIAECAVRTDTPLEINIKLRDRKPVHYEDGDFIMYPHRKFWEIVSEYPVRCVYGFDAHDTDMLMDMSNYTKADEILKGLHLEFITEPLI